MAECLALLKRKDLSESLVGKFNDLIQDLNDCTQIISQKVEPKQLDQSQDDQENPEIQRESTLATITEAIDSNEQEIIPQECIGSDKANAVKSIVGYTLANEHCLEANLFQKKRDKKSDRKDSPRTN